MTIASKHIRPLLPALACVAMLCLCGSGAMAQVPSGTKIENQARGHFRFGTGDRDTVRSNTVQTVVSSTDGPFLLLAKSVDLPIVAPGGTLLYTLSVENQGTSPATSLRMIDTLPKHESFVSASDGGVLLGPAVVWTIPDLPAGATARVTLTVRIDNGFLEGLVVNKAYVSSAQGISATSNSAESRVSTYIATGLRLTATRDAIIGNGTDTTTLGADVIDAAGIGAPEGTAVLFTTTRGRFPNGRDTITVGTRSGIARVTLASETVVNDIRTADVGASTISASGRVLRDSGSVRFYSGAIAGTVISKSSGEPIVGAEAFAYDMAGTLVSSDTTDERGYYILPVPERGDYAVLIRYTNRHGNVVEIRSVVNVDAPAGAGGTAPTSATSSISGTVIDQQTGKPLRDEGVSVVIEPLGLARRASAQTKSVTTRTSADGSFTFDSLSLGIYRIRIAGDRFQGSIDVADTMPGLMVIDSDIEASEIPRLSLLLSSTKRIAEIGDVVGYSLEASNRSASVHLDHLAISIAIPPGFSYIAGSSRLEGRTLADPSGARTLLWALPDTLSTGSTIRLTWRAVAAAGAIDGDGTTRASALALAFSGDSARSAVVEAMVDVRAGIFTDRGIVLGRVFNDANRNARQDEGEVGIAGVELWMEDGTRITTGDDGHYSVPQVLPGERVVRVNRASLPTGARLVDGGTAFSGDPLSRFVTMVEGGIARADFYLLAPAQASLGFSIEPGSLSAVGGSAVARFLIRVDDSTTRKIVLLDTLPAGLHYDLTTLALDGVAIKVDGKISRTLSVPLHTLSIGDADTLTVSIVADSAGVGIPIGRRGVLILSYPKGRDARFRAVDPAEATLGLHGSVREYEPRRYYTDLRSFTGGNP